MASLKPIVLATQSAYKQQLFSQLGIQFQAVKPVCEEHFLQGLTPCEQAKTLAREKAESIAGAYPESCVIGADQILSCQDQLLQKPGTPQRAVEQLKSLRGIWHELHTAICVLSADSEPIMTCVTSRLKLDGTATDAFLEKVVYKDHAWDCVGAYKLESMGIALFEAIETSDYTAIIGLPLLSLASIFRGMGYFD